MIPRGHDAQITKLVFEYSERIDTGDLAGVADLLAEAGFGRGTGDLVYGRDRIQALFERTVHIYEDGTPRTKHLVTNLVVEVDEPAGTASARSYWTVVQALPDRGLGPILSGGYRDRFALRDGVWRFTERRIVTHLVGDTRHHLLPGAPGFE